MKRPVHLIIFILTIIIGLAVGQASMANQLSTTGSELALIQQQVDNYKRENTVLQEQLLDAMSLTNISEKAKTLGFDDAKKQLSLVDKPSLALR